MAEHSPDSSLPLHGDDDSDSEFVVGARGAHIPPPVIAGGNPRPKIQPPKSCFAILKQISLEASSQQRKIIEDLGFRFILQLPTNFARKHNVVAWLLSNYNEELRSFVLDRGAPIPITKELLCSLFGFTLHATYLAKKHVPFDDETRFEAGRILSFNHPCDSVSLFRSRDVIFQLLGKEMDGTKESSFRAALIIFVVGHFLAPRVGQYEVDGEIVEAICSPKGITGYDWATYTMERLAEAAAHVKKQMEEGCPGNTLQLDGCSHLCMMAYYLSVAVPSKTKFLRKAEPPLFRYFDIKRVNDLEKRALLERN